MRQVESAMEAPNCKKQKQKKKKRNSKLEKCLYYCIWVLGIILSCRKLESFQILNFKQEKKVLTCKSKNNIKKNAKRKKMVLQLFFFFFFF